MSKTIQGLATAITKKEGKKKQVDVAQVNEVLRCLRELIAEDPEWTGLLFPIVSPSTSVSEELVSDSIDAKPSVVAKMNCHFIQVNEQEAFAVKTVNMMAVYGEEGENADFSKATPSGSVVLDIDESTPAVSFFEQGEDYYVTFVKAEK